MEKIKEIYKGKAKTLYTCENENYLITHFRDDTSAFDGEKLVKLSNKGAINNNFNAFIMDFLAKNGIATHFIRQLNANDSLVKKLEMIPIECVVRNIAAGSICRRLGIEKGKIISPPLLELFLKNDKLHDPLITEDHIKAFAYAKETEIQEMRKLSLAVNEILKPKFEASGLILVDFKLEFGKQNGEIILGDEFTPDGCRVWDKATGESLDKDRFRQDLGNVVESYQIIAKRLGVITN